ncbi:MAG: T9SS type A sorting domain-containing protein, partial [Bacteroidota bacterium]
YDYYCLNILQSITTYEKSRQFSTLIAKEKEVFFYDQGYIAICEQADQPITQAEVFPNPASEELHIRTEIWNLEEVQLEIWDYTGKRVRYEVQEKGPYFMSIGVQTLPSGHYLLRFSHRDTTLTQKIRIDRK